MRKAEVECCEEVCVHGEKIKEVLTEIPEEELVKELADFYKSEAVMCSFESRDVCL
mgnify:CR=1 FL=1